MSIVGPLTDSPEVIRLLNELNEAKKAALPYSIRVGEAMTKYLQARAQHRLLNKCTECCGYSLLDSKQPNSRYYCAHCGDYLE